MERKISAGFVTIGLVAIACYAYCNAMGLKPPGDKISGAAVLIGMIVGLVYPAKSKGCPACAKRAENEASGKPKEPHEPERCA